MITTVFFYSCDSLQAAIDWAVPQSSRLKYRQLFNSHDKMMSGHLTGTKTNRKMFLSNNNHFQASNVFLFLLPDLCFRPPSSHYPDAVQSSSKPAGYNMVSTLKPFKLFFKRISLTKSTTIKFPSQGVSQILTRMES